MLTHKKQLDDFLKTYTRESDGVVVNVMTIPAGSRIGKHVHPYSHLSALASGHVIVRVSGEPDRELSGFNVIDIEEYKSHVIEAVEDSIWMCIHSKAAINDADQLKLVRG